VRPLVLTLRDYPDQRLDMAALVPQRLIGLSAPEINAIEIQTTRVRVTIGDAFKIKMGDPQMLRIEGGCDRLDRIGHAMASGDIEVEGDAGAQTGRAMRAGRLTVTGNTGPWTGSCMKGGHVLVHGSTGERVGGPLSGETLGMRGGVIYIAGNAGERAGDRLRRGTIIVAGKTGPYAGSRMIAGTLIVQQQVAALPGYLMRRGTLVLLQGTEQISPSFRDCGVTPLVALRLMARFVEPFNAKIAALMRAPMRRFAGDMAVLGRGELLLAD
jgi:formylmethanofuran dehydrogenase subunit C